MENLCILCKFIYDADVLAKGVIIIWIMFRLDFKLSQNTGGNFEKVLLHGCSLCHYTATDILHNIHSMLVMICCINNLFK
jgi:hypothetical protein